jgi:hypothetical protein
MPGRQLRPVNKKSPAEAGLKVCHAKRDEEGPHPAEVYWINRAADSTWLGNRPPRSPCPRAKPNWARGSGSSYGLKKIVKAVANAPMMTSANTKSNRSVFMVPSARRGRR